MATATRVQYASLFAIHVVLRKPHGGMLIHRIKYDIHGLDVLQCGEDGLSGQQGMNHHVNPGKWHQHKKHG
jgi:hypothetical protein